MVVSRGEVKAEERWNVEELYSTLEAWRKEFNDAVENPAKPQWPQLEAFKGKIGDSPEQLSQLLDTMFSIVRQLEKLYTYAHLRHDEDIVNNDHKVANDEISLLFHHFQSATAWIEPEILSLSNEQLNSWKEDDNLKKYRFYLEKLIRQKKHTLNSEQELLLARVAKSLETAHKAFGALNNADFKFGKVLDGEGEEKELTHASLGLFLREKDRTLRENAFKTLHNKFLGYENTLTELLSGNVQAHHFSAQSRHYSSCLEAALYPKNVDVEVYHSLINTVRENLGSLHRYIAFRKEVMAVKELHLYDMYVPLVSEVDMKMSYEEGEEKVIASVAPLGSEYQNLLRQGMIENRWVDRYENKNKRSGAYSSGCYDSMPYILMNFKGTFNDVSTLAHEAGHSMHSLLSHMHQPYHNSHYPIFVAEVASTFNEELLMMLMLENIESREEKLFLINQKLEDIRATFFRQTMFAEFELKIHSFVEKGIPLTATLLKEEYRELNKAYFGPAATIDEEIDIEWARIPHFYYNFYVYQYATGISAALSLVERVVNGGEQERNDYLNFLKGGGSKYPLDLLRGAGVDLATPDPIKTTIRKFDSLLEDLESLMGVSVYIKPN